MRYLIISLLILVVSCTTKKQDEQLQIIRMEQTIFNCPVETIADSIPYFYDQFGTFFHIFTEDIINIGDTSNPSFSDYLTNYLTNFAVNQSYQQTQKKFPDLNAVEEKLSDAFSNFKEQFPNKKKPQIYSCISGFNQGIIALDTIVGIGLDMYLGRDYEGYLLLWPDKGYKRYNLHKNKIPSDVLQFWGQAVFPYNNIENHVLSNMIYYGKNWYFSKALMPKEADTLIFGFTPDQLNWCENNEKQMWTYLIENKLLYNSDYMVINKIVGESPFTHYFTRESPGQSCVWLGYRIVSEYVSKNNVSLAELMNENDFQKILRMSGYNPR